MRKIILASAIILVAPALPFAGQLGGHVEQGVAEDALQRQIAPGGVAGSDQGDLLGGKVILAKGDKSGTGPGAGGHKGQKKGGKHGKQHGKQDTKPEGKGKTK